MELPVLFNDNELLMWDRGGFFIFLIISLFFHKYQKSWAVVIFVVICCPHVYNFLRDRWEIDSDEESKAKEMEFSEWKLELEKEKMKEERNMLLGRLKEECLGFVERLRVLEKENKAIDKINEEKLLKLEEKCATLEEEKDDLAYELEDLANKLFEERRKVSDLEEKCETLEKEKDDIGKKLEEEREVRPRIAIEQLREMAEMLEKGLLEKSDKNDEQVKKIEEDNEVGKMLILEKKFKKLMEEKKVWEGERESLLVVLDSQTSVVEAYKDMLNKEQCLMKLFGENNIAKYGATQGDLVAYTNAVLDYGISKD